MAVWILHQPYHWESCNFWARKSSKSWGLLFERSEPAFLFLLNWNQHCFVVFCNLVSLGIYQNLSIGHDLFFVAGGNNTEISPFKRGESLDVYWILHFHFSHTYLLIAFVYLVVDFFHPHEATNSGFSISMCEISLKTSGSLRENVSNFSGAAALRDSEFHPFDGIPQPRRESDNISSLDDQGTIPTISDPLCENHIFLRDGLGIN